MLMQTWLIIALAVANLLLLVLPANAGAAKR
jgi:hypothetical protein